MKILTDSQYESILKKAKEEGYKNGLHKGLTTDRKGIFMSGASVYVFDDNIMYNATFKEASI